MTDAPHEESASPRVRRGDPPDVVALAARVAEQQRDIDESRSMRQTYVPVIIRTAERVDAIEESLTEAKGLFRNEIEKLATSIDGLANAVQPLLTERKMIMKAISFPGGVVLGAVALAAREPAVQIVRALFHKLVN